jgi:hypothetical protein
MSSELDTEDIVLVEGEPSMRLIASPTMESPRQAKPKDSSNSDKIQHDLNTSSHSVPVPSQGFFGCQMPFRSSLDYSSFPRMQPSLPENPGCYHNTSRGREVVLGKNCSYIPERMWDMPVPPPLLPEQDFSFGSSKFKSKHRTSTQMSIQTPVSSNTLFEKNRDE